MSNQRGSLKVLAMVVDVVVVVAGMLVCVSLEATPTVKHHEAMFNRISCKVPRGQDIVGGDKVDVRSQRFLLEFSHLVAVDQLKHGCSGVAQECPPHLSPDGNAKKAPTRSDAIVGSDKVFLLLVRGGNAIHNQGLDWIVRKQQTQHLVVGMTISNSVREAHENCETSWIVWIRDETHVKDGQPEVGSQPPGSRGTGLFCQGQVSAERTIDDPMENCLDFDVRFREDEVGLPLVQTQSATKP